jgi:RNA polymerase sigma-70 factor, ECF subfamily
MQGDITELLDAWRRGSAEAGEAVVAMTYDQLRRVARTCLRGERRSHTLQPTALLHEAYLSLLRTGPGSVQNRDAFLRLMATAMRRRLVDHARRRLAGKRGRGVIHQELEPSSVAVACEADSDIEATLRRLDRALEDLTGSFPRAALVVQLRFIAGLTTEDTAQQLGLSPGTVKRDWTFARAWLAGAMSEPPHGESGC